MPIREMYSLLSATSRAVRHPLLVNGARHRLFHSNARVALSAHDPVGEDSPLGPELKRMQKQMLENPELLSSVMDSPMMQQMMQNPEMFGRMIQMHPQMATVLEQNPQLKAMMANPQLLRQAMEAMRDPEMLKARLQCRRRRQAATGDSAAEAAGDSAEEDARAGVHDAAFRDVGPERKWRRRRRRRWHKGTRGTDGNGKFCRQRATICGSFGAPEPAVMRDAIHRLATLQGQVRRRRSRSARRTKPTTARQVQCGGPSRTAHTCRRWARQVSQAWPMRPRDILRRRFGWRRILRLLASSSPTAPLPGRGDDEQQAERHLRAVLELLPGHAPARLQLGYLYLAKDKFAEAAPQPAEAAKYLPRGDVAPVGRRRILRDARVGMAGWACGGLGAGATPPRHVRARRYSTRR